MQAVEWLLQEPDNASPDEVAIRTELERIVSSEGFSGSPRLQQLLTYIVTETIEGRADRIKGLSIAQDVYGQVDPEAARTSTVVSVEARRLRRKLSDYYLGVGANAPIVIEIPKGAFVPIFRHAAMETKPETSTAQPVQNLARNTPRWYLVFAIVVLVFLSVVLLWSYVNRVASPAFESAALERPVIAVIPFRNLTGNVQNEVLVTGMTEDITADLAQLHEIDVISYSSTSLLTNPDMPPKEIGQLLHVSHIVQGSVRGNAQNVRVNAELLDVRSGKLIWASHFDGTLSDPMKLQDKIAAKVVEGMPGNLAEWDNRGNKTLLSTTPETAALFEQAMSLANPPSDAARLKIAYLAFQAVIESDPAFGGGYAGTAYVSVFRALWGHASDSHAAAEMSASMAERALDVDPNSPLALDALALSQLVMRDFDAAVRTSERALQLAPNDPYVQSYHAFILTADGQAARAVSFAEKAVRLDPLDPRTPFRNILGVVHLHAGNYELALRFFTENNRLKGPQSAGHQANMAASYAGLGDKKEASRFAAMLPNGFRQGPWLDWHKRNFRTQEDVHRIPDLLESALCHTEGTKC